MTEVIISAETEVWTTRERDPDDSWDAGDTEGRVSDVRAAIKTDLHGTQYWGDSICKEFPGVSPGDTLYAVVADYSSGSTFGRSGGHASVIDAFTSYERADALAKAARDERSDFQFNHDGQDYYASWVGYFESLNSIDVWKVTVNGYSEKL